MSKANVEFTEVDQPIVMALVLDVANRKERVLIGSASDVRNKLEGEKVENIIYDEERRLGQLIFDFELQNRSDWNSNIIFPMRQALRDRCSQEVWEGPLWDLMIDKMESDNAVEVYTAHNAMLYYNAERAVPLGNRKVDIFERRMMRLVNPYHGALLDAKDGRFLLYAQEKIQEMVGKWRYSAEVEMRVWYPWNRFDMDVAIAEHDLLPLIIYYLHQLRNCGCDLRICDCCGSRFFSRSGHITLCGETCVSMNKKWNEKGHAESTHHF